MLERHVWTLVQARAAAVHREQQVELTVNARWRHRLH